MPSPPFYAAVPQPPAGALYRQPGPGRIEVTGEASVSAEPDRAVIVLGVVTENLSLTEAQAANREASARVIASLTALPLPRDAIATVDYRIEMQYVFEENKQRFTGYKVTHMLQITLNDTARAGTVVDTAVASGANTVSSVSFRLAHPQPYYHAALSAAVQEAYRKAGTVARTLSVRLSPQPQLVEELSRVPEPVPYHTAMLADSKVTPLQPGTLQVTASVKVVYTYL
ncbi:MULTISPECIES: SIMPL domain-containing protein [Paenibacillus]|uniref:SIMPL domain-containing protein n=1 Tax=Paenibacillus TaxID=44249 RepID=UPI0022B8F577|nr:SIMPL domain-containing protein [Paenibacillus caseinilyticus]MCZ8521105.1 SIMPL domain-containing protein [Paenibacillus caseinilyticus]